jgi:hypothetical protein
MCNLLKVGALAGSLAVLLTGCAATPVSGPVTYDHCPPDFHTEAFPNNPNPKRAYACRSNQSGYLSPDYAERMRPL